MMNPSVHISESSQNSSPNESIDNTSLIYQFSFGNLDDIPHPDDLDSYTNKPHITSTIASEDSDLPLPPGCSDNEPVFAVQKSTKQPWLSSCDFVPPLPLEDFRKPFNTEEIPLPKSDIQQSEKNIFHSINPPLPKPSDTAENNNIQTDRSVDWTSSFKNLCETETETEAKISLDNNKYSPSKVESDDENQELIATKPKVLGKEQAKKRLMAFSLSKQPSTAMKKPVKVVAAAKPIKEKPPNPNKSSGVQEQFRNTISEIEEEKRKMIQNMPNYLLLEMSDLAKSSHSILSSSLHLLEKYKNENPDCSKDEIVSIKSSEPIKGKDSIKRNRRRSESRDRSYRRSRSRSKRRIRSRSRKRSTDRNYRKSQSRSRSRSRHKSRSRSPAKKLKDEKNNQKDYSFPKDKELPKNWKSFKDAKLIVGDKSWNAQETQKEKKMGRKRSASPVLSTDVKPTFNYWIKDSKLMVPFQVRPANPGTEGSILFPEKIIKFTKTKPSLSWAENPSCASDFYMTRKMLLEKCDRCTSDLLNDIIKSKDVSIDEDLTVPEIQDKRFWYPRNDFNLSENSVTSNLESNINSRRISITNEEVAVKYKEKLEQNKEIANKSNFTKTDTRVTESLDISEKQGKNASKERRISLVNDSYLSEDEDGLSKVKEVVVGDVKVQLDLDLNSVKVRSKWDSDYEGEINEKETTAPNKVDTGAVTESVAFLKKENQSPNDFNLNSHCLETLNKDLNVKEVNTIEKDGNLASEYEEFMKMVSFEPNDNCFISDSGKPVEDFQKNDSHKTLSAEKTSELRKPKFESTDWDQESDIDDKNVVKVDFKNDAKNKFLFNDIEKSDSIIKKEKKNSIFKKKFEKLNLKTTKVSKKASKAKKKKYESSSSSDSSSDSYDSDSESESDDSKSSKKKQRKKVLKGKKKSKKKYSSSDSDSSDSDDSKSKKEKKKNKKTKKSKKKSTNHSDEEIQSSLLKQLDFKKQLIMKKIEEIDSISERSGKKKEKQNKQKSKDKLDLDESNVLKKYIKNKKKAKTHSKDKKKSKKNAKSFKKESSESSTSSDSEDEKQFKKKKTKKLQKKRKVSSDSSDSGEEVLKRTKSQSNLDKQIEKKENEKQTQKNKRTKKSERRSFSSSDSYSEDSSSIENKKSKKTKKLKSDEELKNDNVKPSNWENCFILDGSFERDGNRLSWRDEKKGFKKVLNTAGNKEKKKDCDDWEASSSPEHSELETKSRESSWDHDVTSNAPKVDVEKNKMSPKKHKSSLISPEKGQNASSKGPVISDNLKTSLPNFSYNENSFCSFGQELSRDFFLTEHSFSNSGAVENSETLKSTIDPRPFQSVSFSKEESKLNKSDLYSPGHSDSEISDVELRTNIEKLDGSNKVCNNKKEEIYDPLNSESEDETDQELSSIPLPLVSDILLPGETRILPNEKYFIGNECRDNTPVTKSKENENTPNLLSESDAFLKSNFTSINTTPLSISNDALVKCLKGDEKALLKKQLMSVKPLQKLKSKAASVFQDESDDEALEATDKSKYSDTAQSEVADKIKKVSCENGNYNKSKEIDELNDSVKRIEDLKKGRKNRSSRSRDKSLERDYRRRRSPIRERKEYYRSTSCKTLSPVRRRRSKTPEIKFKNSSKDEPEIKSDCFEIEPLKRSPDLKEVDNTVQPIPVLTGLGVTAIDRSWNRSHLSGYSDFSEGTVNISNSESFDIYPENSKLQNRSFDKAFSNCFDVSDKSSYEKSCKSDKFKRDRRRSRSRSLTPRKKRRSKSPDRRKSPRNRSPRRRSKSPKRRDKSPFSPRKRSPKRKCSPRRSKGSRSPERRKNSRSRSPQKRRSSPSRRSRSYSPRKHRSPKRHEEASKKMNSPIKTFSPTELISSSQEASFPPFTNEVHNRIPVIGTTTDNIELSPRMSSFPRHISDSLIDSEMNENFYTNEYTSDFGPTNYQEEMTSTNLITVKHHDVEKPHSPERLSLDQRIELELGVQANSGSLNHSEQYHIPNQGCPIFQDINSTHFTNSYNCDNSNTSNENFYPGQGLGSDFNGQYFNSHPPPPNNYGSFQQYNTVQPAQSSVLQVGNIVEVVPTPHHNIGPPPTTLKPQIMQVGNVLQVVPTQKPGQTSPVGSSYGSLSNSLSMPPVKTQKATAVVAPSSIVQTPTPEAAINPLIKAIQLEREKRKKEKEKRKAEREARRKARQLRREAKLMSVNEKLKKSVQDEGLMLGQEVEDDELMDGAEVPSPPLPVEIITVSSPGTLPPAGKGILISAGFVPKPPSEKKEVKFADGVCPGEGTSTSEGEETPISPPKPKLPKEKRFKKKKIKVKKKVKVQIIRQIIENEEDEDDDLSPPPPPPGDPPPVFFARFPFASNAQFPVYQSQTTTTTLTTVQFQTQ